MTTGEPPSEGNGADGRRQAIERLRREERSAAALDGLWQLHAAPDFADLRDAVLVAIIERTRLLAVVGTVLRPFLAAVPDRSYRGLAAVPERLRPPEGLAEAVRLFERLARPDLCPVPILVTLLIDLRAARGPAAVLTIAEAALARHGPVLTLRLFVARTLLDQGRPAAAAPHIEAVFRDHPALPTAYRFRAQQALAQGRCREAAVHYHLSNLLFRAGRAGLLPADERPALLTRSYRGHALYAYREGFHAVAAAVQARLPDPPDAAALLAAPHRRAASLADLVPVLVGTDLPEARP